MDVKDVFDSATAFGLEMMGSILAEWVSRVLAIIAVFILISEVSWASCNGSPTLIEITKRLFFSFGTSFFVQSLSALIEARIMGFEIQKVIRLIEEIKISPRTALFVISMLSSMIGLWITVEGGAYGPNACFSPGRIVRS